MDSEESNDQKMKEITAKLNRLFEEKEKIETDSTLSIKRKQREIDEIKMKLEAMENEIETLKIEKDAMAKELQKAKELGANTANSLQHQKDISNDQISVQLTNDKLLDGLRESLTESEGRVRELESLVGVLKRNNEESSEKLVRVYKKYKVLSQQYKATRSHRRESVNSVDSSSPMNSRKGSMVNMSISEDQQSPQNGLSSRDTAAGVSNSNKASNEESYKEKVEYIKNVLLGFLEHKEQRAMLLPVVKTLLLLDNNDEKRFLSSIAS
ncbi:unnamed protein product [[Candida] boidinii]|nr:unnamed protein product [[Candida] boidinii]